MEFSQEEVDDIWESVKNFAYKQSYKWRDNKEEFVQLAAENVCIQIKKVKDKKDAIKYAMNAIGYTHDKAAKIFIKSATLVNIEDCYSLHDKKIVETNTDYIYDAIEELDFSSPWRNKEQEEKMKYIVKQFVSGVSLASIARELGLSRQAVSILNKHGIDKLKFLLEEKGISI